MGMAFDHSQYLTNIRMALGEASETIKHAAPFTDREFMRSLVDPGFWGSIRYLEADLYFEGGVTVIQDVTWKWQAKGLGDTAWVDMHEAVMEQWTGQTDTGLRVGLDASDLSAMADSVPLEVRLLVSAQVEAEITVRIGGVNVIPAIRVFGESL